MRVLFKLFKGVLFVILILFLGTGAILFFKPGLILNPKTLGFALNNTNLLEEWSWKSAEIEHDWLAWNKRKIIGRFKDFCFAYKSDGAKVESCLDTLAWDVNVGWSPGEGFFVQTETPVTVDSKRAVISLAQGEKDEESQGPPPDVYKLWKGLWSDMFPDLDVNFDEVVLKTGDNTFSTGVEIKKIRENLSALAFGFQLQANQKGLRMEGLKDFKLPFEAEAAKPLYARNLKLAARVKESSIPVEITGSLADLPFEVRSFIPLPLRHSVGSPSFLKRIALNTEVFFEAPEIEALAQKNMRPPYDALPAPFNALSGGLKVFGHVKEGRANEEIEININTTADLDGARQELDFQLLTKVLFNLNSFELGAVFLDLNLQKVVLQLPRLPETSLPPQLKPDPRIHGGKTEFHQALAQKQEEPLDLNMKIQAVGQNALSFRTNLLDEILRLNVDIAVERGEVRKGYIKALPLKTTFFRRDIHLKELLIRFDHPKEPEIEATVDFLLPEYKVTMKLEGPLSAPQHAFSSEPPLPQADIYAVLLFGRPMMELDAGDRDAAARTNQILSQGFLSLAVLYYFSGSPVEAVIYDPNSNEVSAQFGLGRRSSLTVGGQSGGVSSVGVRYSLGGGWYIDTSARRRESLNNAQKRDYGILLERIIAY